MRILTLNRVARALMAAMLPIAPLTLANGISVDGAVESETGFRFSDGTLQATAMDDAGYENTISVADTGGDFSTIQAAIDSISDASASKPYVVKVAPGDYQHDVVLKPFVSLEGSGEDATQLKGLPCNPAVRLVEGAQIRSMRIHCYVDSGPVVGVGVSDAGDDVRVQDVTVDILNRDPDGSTTGILVGSSGGVTVLDLENIEVQARGALGGTSRVAAIRNSANTTVNLHRSNVRAYDGEDCTGLRIEGGVVNAYASGIEAFTSGEVATGAYLRFGSGIFRNSEFTVNASRCFGLHAEDASSVSLDQSTIEADGDDCSTQWGMLAQGDGTAMNIDVTNSAIHAGDYTVFNPLNPSSVVFRHTYFDGGPAIGNNTCLFATEETLDPLLGTDECP